jgi:hypothetical protein
MKQETADPLPSWNHGKAKLSIEAFVQRTATARTTFDLRDGGPVLVKTMDYRKRRSAGGQS